MQAPFACTNLTLKSSDLRFSTKCSEVHSAQMHAAAACAVAQQRGLSLAAAAAGSRSRLHSSLMTVLVRAGQGRRGRCAKALELLAGGCNGPFVLVCT